MFTKKLKLKIQWVANTIRDEYKTWKLGDVVIIQAMTGTGKTWFIKNVLIDHIKEHERLLFVCNRTHLKRQLKKDLLEKYGMKVPETLEELDKITTIRNICITSYHAIQERELDKEYGVNKQISTIHYDYIICDECHYILADGSFNNKCRIAYEKLIKNTTHSSIKIFISATMEEIEEPILSMNDKSIGVKPKIHKYTTGIDYSYVNAKYFKELDDIISLIKNDKTDEKWIIFITDLDDSKYIINELGEDKCSLIKSGTKSEEVTNIINNSQFEKKILICTKAMDNGINIADDKVTNMVVMAWDRVTFIQELGRKRINIEDAQTINLYIPVKSKKSFSCKINNYNFKLNELDLFKNDINKFNRKYDNSLKKISNMEDIFYKKKDEGWEINKIGRKKLKEDIKFAQYMLDKFKNEGKFAYITEQLSWLQLENTFDESNLIENVVLDEDVETLEEYLLSIKGEVMYQAPDRKELIEKIGIIDKHNSNLNKKKNSGEELKIVYIKNREMLNKYLLDVLQIDFYIKEFPTSKIIDNQKKNFNHAWEIMQGSNK